MLPSSDHIPLSFVFDFMCTSTFIDTYTCPSNKVNFNWTKATDKDLIHYKYLTRMYCKNIHAADVVKCNDVNCKYHDHLNEIDTLYSQLGSVLKQASDDSIPTSKIHTHHDYIVPGFNEFAKQLHSEARGDYLLWKASGEFMTTAIVPIIKNKSGNTSDKSNYRPIALVTACSKIFESCLLKMLEHYLETHDHQFGFKSQHAKDMCIFTVKSVIKHYTKRNSTVFTCFLDAAKAFDRVSH